MQCGEEEGTLGPCHPTKLYEIFTVSTVMSVLSVCLAYFFFEIVTSPPRQILLYFSCKVKKSIGKHSRLLSSGILGNIQRFACIVAMLAISYLGLRLRKYFTSLQFTNCTNVSFQYILLVMSIYVK